MANRTVSKIFRCTPEEAQEIVRMAEENNLSEADFIWKKIFRLSSETDQLLQELEYYDVKIGNNINQISHPFATICPGVNTDQEDWRSLRTSERHLKTQIQERIKSYPSTSVSVCPQG